MPSAASSSTRRRICHVRASRGEGQRSHADSAESSWCGAGVRVMLVVGTSLNPKHPWQAWAEGLPGVFWLLGCYGMPTATSSTSSRTWATASVDQSDVPAQTGADVPRRRLRGRGHRRPGGCATRRAEHRATRRVDAGALERGRRARPGSTKPYRSSGATVWPTRAAAFAISGALMPASGEGQPGRAGPRS